MQNNAGRRPLKDITPGWKEVRRDIADLNDTHPAFRPDKSQLTITGQLLDAIYYKISKTKSTVKIDVLESNRAPYFRRIAGEIIWDVTEKTNRDIAKEQAEAGRQILQLDKEAQEIIVNRIRQEIRRRLGK